VNLWHEMGLSGKRAIIIHQDDLGVTEAQGRAYRQLGLPTASVMLPGGWAPMIREGDLGVHITLTSEWEAPRMRPLTAGRSLRDQSGYFPSTLEQAWQQMDPADVAAEMRAQIEAAYALGIDVTHIDTHMGAIMRPDIAQAYVELALQFQVPAFLPDESVAARLPAPFREPLLALLAAAPLPRVTLVDSYPVPNEERAAWYVETLAGLGPGVYHLIHHAAVPTDEGKALRDWQLRQGDLEALQSPAFRKVLDGFVLLTYREIRDAMRRYR